MNEQVFSFSIVQMEVLTPQLKTGAIILLFIFFDIVTGLIKSFASHSYESSQMRKGLFHKLAELICYIFGVVCDLMLPYIGVEIPVSISQAICIYIVIMEIGSVIENIGIINPDLGKRLHKIFAKFENYDILTEDEKGEPESEEGNLNNE